MLGACVFFLFKVHLYLVIYVAIVRAVLNLNMQGKWEIPLVAPGHRSGLKNLLNLWKERISGILFFNEDILCLRSRHLVLWSPGTLTGQQRFYGTRLVTQKGRHYHPLSVLPKASCIANFVINC